MAFDNSYDVSVNYGPKGLENNWDRKEQSRDPRRSEKYVQAMVQAGILPNDVVPNDFTFYSPSANQRTIEFAVASHLNQLPTENTSKPKVIMSDIFGEQRKVEYTTPQGNKDTKMVFVPAFHNNQPQYENVNMLTCSADAKKIPLSNHLVDVIWDRLGALWYALSYKKYGEGSDNAVNDLLQEYKRILKPDGALVVDAGGNGNTFQLAEELDLPSIGWSMTLSGDGDNRIAILKPTN